MEYKYYKSGATLIIAPVTLVGQWEKECDERTNGNNKFNYKRYYGSRSRNISLYINRDIVLTTYGILGKENGSDRSKHVLHKIYWHRIILDESHYIKNASTCTSRNILNLYGTNKWCLTGTPFGRQINGIENQLNFIGMQQRDLNALNLNIISRQNVFNNGNDSIYHNKNQAKPLINIFPKLVMRHKKEQKFNNKPIVNMTEKEENVIFINFTTKQREYYDKLYNIAKQKYDYYVTINNVGRGSLSILSSLLPARQACSGRIYTKVDIEQELSDAQARTFRIQQMVNQSQNNLNLSRAELFEMAEEEAYEDRDGECPICYECPFDEPLQTPCLHIFCRECIVSILHEKPKCPMCRADVKINQLKQPKSKKKLNQQQNDKEENDDDDDDDEQETETETQEKKEEDDDDDDDGKIKFDSKMKKLVEELNKIKQEKPNDKVLIFTSFSNSLNWICQELKKNGFEYRTLTGSMTMNKRKKQLEEFSNNSNVGVFVLTVRSGAVGITLTSANHVFMMEPPFNPSLYRQAINRVYRLGQKKKVHCHTLIMKNSIEERIWNINKDKQKEDDNNNDNNNNNNDKKKKRRRNIAGNINADKNVKLETNEIARLFQVDENDNEQGNNDNNENDSN